MQIWAHRGASAYAPENTMEAFEKAIDLHADGVELDVQFCRDGKLVVLHDETLQRVSNGYGYVKDYTLEELKELNFSRMMPEYHATAIPTLREVLQLIGPTELLLNIELKTNRFSYEGIEEKTIEMVEQYGLQDRVWYSSFNHYSLKKVKALRPKARCGVLYSDGIYHPMAYAAELGMDAIHPAVSNLRYLDDEETHVQTMPVQRLHVHPWTANSCEEIESCIRAGVDAVITNYPDHVRLVCRPTKVGHFVFDNPFADSAKREYYLFGAGYLGSHFLKRYRDRPRPICVLDNGRAKWGTSLAGLDVKAPSCLKPGDCVVIASAFYAEMIAQLEKLGVTDYYVYHEQSVW